MSDSEIQRLRMGMRDAMCRSRAAAFHGVEQGPFKVAEKISKESFQQWSSKILSSAKVAFVMDKLKGAGTAKTLGTVFHYGDTSELHSTLPSFIAAQWAESSPAFSQLVQVLDGIQVFQDAAKEPDMAFTSMSSSSAKPRTVLELAYKNEPLPVLKREMKEWHRRGAKLAMGIKVTVKTERRVPTVELHYVEQRWDSAKLKVVDFSLGVCTSSNRSKFLLKLPFRCFTDAMSQEKDLELDLYELQQEILRELILDMEKK